MDVTVALGVVYTAAAGAGVWKSVCRDINGLKGIDEIVVVVGGGVEVPEMPESARVIDIPWGGGPGAYRNTILRQAKSDVVIFADDDDYHDPSRIEAIRGAFVADPDVYIVTSGFSFQHGSKKSRRGTVTYTTAEANLVAIVNHDIPAVAAAGIAVRRLPLIEAGVWFPQGLQLYEDYVFIARGVAKYPLCFISLPQQLWTATDHPESLLRQARPGNPRGMWQRPSLFYLYHAIHTLFARTPWSLDSAEVRDAGSRYALGLEVGDDEFGVPGFIDAASDATRSRRPVTDLHDIPTLPPQPEKPDEPEEPPEPDRPAKPRPQASKRPGVLYVGTDVRAHHAMIQPLARAHQREYSHVELKKDDFFRVIASAVKKAGLVVLWNGAQGVGRSVTALCESMKIPVVYFEWGVAPQNTTYLVDLKGMSNRSMLMDPLSWVTDDDVEAFEAGIAPLRKRFPLKPIKNRVLVPVQIENDSQVLYAGAWRGMRDFVESIQYAYPGKDIVVRPHPKSGNKWNKPSRVPPGITVESKEDVPDFFAAAAKSEIVVGLNSTTLVESEMLGVPAVAFGDCPLRAQPLFMRQRLLAAYWVLRLRRGRPITDVTDRFNVRPIG